MKKVILTGGTGFVGRQAILALVGRGFEVHALTIDPFPAKLKSEQVFIHPCDLFNPQETKKVLEKIQATHLLHFAWYAEPGKFWNSEKNLQWVQASLDLVAAFREAGGNRAVMAGTCAEYDWNSGPCDEATTPKNPLSLYGRCKLELHEKFDQFVSRRGISYGWGHIFFLYGPYEHPDRLVPSVILSLLQGRQAKCTHGKQVRDFMHVEDVGAAFAAFLDSQVTGAVNIASGKSQSIGDILRLIGSKMGREDLLNFGAIKAPDDEPPKISANTQKLNKEIGWAPKYSLENGLEMTIDWWRRSNPRGL